MTIVLNYLMFVITIFCLLQEEKKSTTYSNENNSKNKIKLKKKNKTWFCEIEWRHFF